MKDFNTMVNEVYISLRRRGVPVKNCPVTISHRLKRAFGNTRCKTRYGERSYSIQIASYLVENGSERGIKSTIAHEYIHTCDGCMNHGALWKRYGNMVSDLYDINRCDTYESKGISNDAVQSIQANREQFKYIVKCNKCNREWKYKRMCKTLKVIERCTCPYCNTVTLHMATL